MSATWSERGDLTEVDTSEATRGLATSEVDLSVDLGGLAMHNPITTASGCFASGAEIDRFYDIAGLGAVVVKSLTLEPREGLPTPRMHETASGMLNAIGLQNPGIDRWLARDLPWLQGKDLPVVVSIAGTTVEEYRELARRLRNKPGVAAIEVNLSCPNVEHRGLVFACHAEPSSEVIRAVVRESAVPVFGKLTPDVTDITAVARAVVDAGATGLSLINTTLGMAIDPDTGVPRLANTFGGLSGPAIKPIAIRAMYQVHQALPQVPKIGMGGLRTVEDVVEMIRAGAWAVAIGTATFADPFRPLDLVTELREWLAARELRSVDQIRGVVMPRTVPTHTTQEP